MPRGFEGDSLSIRPTPLVHLDPVTDSAPATVLATIEGRSHHPPSARAPAHGLGVTMIARIMAEHGHSACDKPTSLEASALDRRQAGDPVLANCASPEHSSIIGDVERK